MLNVMRAWLARRQRELFYRKLFARQLHSSNAWYCGGECCRHAALPGLITKRTRLLGVVVETVQLTKSQKEML